MADKGLTVTRVINAPRQKVWRAWTDVNELREWWGPRGVTNPKCVWEAKPGGKISVTMLAGAELGELKGTEWPMDGEFQEVIPQEKLVFMSCPLADGQPIMETRCTVMLEDQGDKTKLTLQIVVTRTTPEAAGALAGMETGWNQSLDKLTESVER